MNPRLLFATIAVALVLGAAAQAAESPLDALFACQKIADGAARLTCLDREVTALRGESRSGEVIAVDRKKLEEDSYGLDGSSVVLPAPPTPPAQHVATVAPATGAPVATAALAAAGVPAASSAGRRVVRDKGGRIEGLENLAVARIDQTPYGQLIVTLQNGQVWEETDRIRLLVPRRVPADQMTVSISNAALGSYKMQLNGDGPWVRARRAN